MGVHQLATLSWPAFRALGGSRLIGVLPLGALEAHGPHLPLGTDLIIAEAMATAGAARLDARGFEVVVLPPVAFSPAPFAAGFAGTVDVAPEVTVGLVAGVARSLAWHGARATVVANAHHDPAHVAAIRAAVELALRDADAGTTLVFPDLTRRRWASRLTEEYQSGACHAGRYETSIVLAAAPDLVDRVAMARLAPNPRSLVTAMQQGQRTFAEAGGPEAYFGWPQDASADEGHDIIDRLGAIVEDAVLEVLSDGGDR